MLSLISEMYMIGDYIVILKNEMLSTLSKGRAISRRQREVDDNGLRSSSSRRMFVSRGLSGPPWGTPFGLFRKIPPGCNRSRLYAFQDEPQSTPRLERV